MKKDEPHITKSVDVFVVIVNTDLTEGRGRAWIKHVCETKATARRLARKQDVQGSDGSVRAMKAHYISDEMGLVGPLFVPGQIEPPNRDDIQEQKRIDAEDERQRQREAALHRAKAAGLSDDDIRILRSGASS